MKLYLGTSMYIRQMTGCYSIRTESFWDAAKALSRDPYHLLTFCRHDIGPWDFQLSAKSLRKSVANKSLEHKNDFCMSQGQSQPRGVYCVFLYVIGLGPVSWCLLCISLGLDNLQ